MYLQIVVITCLTISSHGYNVSYDGYQLYEVLLSQNDTQYRIINSLRNNEAMEFWTETRNTDNPQHILVQPDSINMFQDILNGYGLEYKSLFENISDKFSIHSSSDLTTGHISFDQYNRYSTIVDYLKELANKYPTIVSLINLGKSYEDRDQLGVKISFTGSHCIKEKPIIFIDGGMHAREWMSPAAVTYIIQQLVENVNNSYMIEKVDWYIVPILNPDGYEYTHTHDRLWRKTRSLGKYTNCVGVDGNRNFDFHWMEVGGSDDECSIIYSGPTPFSEIETTNLKNFVLQHKQDIKLYLSFHAYGQYLLYPWAYTRSYPDNNEELKTVAKDVAKAIKNVRGTVYTVGSSTNVLYAAAGGSDDWMKGVVGVPLAYTIELPGRDGGFHPSPSEIKGVVSETFQGIKVYHKYIEEKWTDADLFC